MRAIAHALLLAAQAALRAKQGQGGKGASLLLPPPVGLSLDNADDDVASLVAKLWHFPTVAGDSEATLIELLTKRFREKRRQIQKIDTSLKRAALDPLLLGGFSRSYRATVRRRESLNRCIPIYSVIR